MRKAKSGGTRSKKIKALTAQIALCQREISLLNPTMFGDMDMDEISTLAMPAVAPAAVANVVTKRSPPKSPQKSAHKSSNKAANNRVASDSEQIDKHSNANKKMQNSVAASIEQTIERHSQAGMLVKAALTLPSAMSTF